MKGVDNMARGKAMRNPNGYGTVVKLSGNRRKPFEVRVNTHIDEWGYPRYDVLGRYESRTEATISLAEYNRSPFDVNKREITFKEVYEMWFDWKYTNDKKTYSKSSINVTRAAFKKCSRIHNTKISDIRTDDMQVIIDDFSLSHAYMEHIIHLMHQVFKYAMTYDIISKDYSNYLKINKDDDDKPGIPFSKEDIYKLWDHVNNVPYCDTVLILIYTGWRISELLEMKTQNIDIVNWTMTGGLKTAAGKNRIVPIHSKIQSFIMNYYNSENIYFIPSTNKADTHLSKKSYYDRFQHVMNQCQIIEKHTPHDCRHTFTSLLDSAGANDVCIDRLVGHASKTLTKKIYTHKDIEDLRKTIELINI